MQQFLKMIKIMLKETKTVEETANNCLVLEAHGAESSEVRGNEDCLLCAVRKAEIKLTAQKSQQEEKTEHLNISLQNSRKNVQRDVNRGKNHRTSTYFPGSGICVQSRRRD